MTTISILLELFGIMSLIFPGQNACQTFTQTHGSNNYMHSSQLLTFALDIITSSPRVIFDHFKHPPVAICFNKCTNISSNRPNNRSQLNVDHILCKINISSNRPLLLGLYAEYQQTPKVIHITTIVSRIIFGIYYLWIIFPAFTIITADNYRCTDIYA